MGIKNVNRLRFGGLVGACIAACFSFLSGDYVTAGGIMAAALSTVGGKVD